MLPGEHDVLNLNNGETVARAIRDREARAGGGLVQLRQEVRAIVGLAERD